MVTEWGDDGGGAQPPATASGWPSRLAGYAKVIAAAVSTLGATGVLAWLQGAGATHLPGWTTAAITAGVGILGVLFGPKNKA